MSSEDFLSEPIVPRAGSFDAAGMGRGEPGAPHAFTWRDAEYTVARLVATWKSSGKSTCGETYLRRHWFDVETTDGSRFTLYCERQARSRTTPKARWWVYSKSQNVETSKSQNRSSQ